MSWFWFSVIVILILAFLAFYGAVRLRRRRFEHRLRLEITNQGNVESHYQLQAEEWSGQLQFRFTSGGNRLPEVIDSTAARAGSISAQPARANGSESESSLSGKAQKGMNLSYAMASLLTSLGTILPGSLGTRFYQAGSRMYSGSAQASRVQQVSSQATGLAASAKSSPPPGTSVPAQPQTAIQPEYSHFWVETPPIQPGQMLAIDLLVRSAWTAQNAACPFKVISRSMESAQALVEVEEGQVNIRGGFWSHRVYPHLLILALTILAIFLAIWIARANGLPV
jgi:hypothetical protein